MGIFGAKANSHAKRQDALAGHVLNYALGKFALTILAEAYVSEHGSMNPDDFMPWLLQIKGLAFTDKQQREKRECPDIAIANFLMHLTRTNLLKELREYGLYENTSETFSDVDIKRTLELAAAVRALLANSYIVPEPMKRVGINMPDVSFDPVTFRKIE
jgi:hypothetical protein